MHHDTVWLKKLDPIITERNNFKTKYDSNTNSWFRFIITSYNASSDNVTPRDDINYNRGVAFIKKILRMRDYLLPIVCLLVFMK